MNSTLDSIKPSSSPEPHNEDVLEPVQTANMNIMTRQRSQMKDCSICQNAILRQGIIDCCSHVYCFFCIKKWSQTENSCPLCKRRFNEIKKSLIVRNLRESRNMSNDSVVMVERIENRSQIDPQTLRFNRILDQIHLLFNEQPADVFPQDVREAGITNADINISLIIENLYRNLGILRSEGPSSQNDRLFYTQENRSSEFIQPRLARMSTVSTFQTSQQSQPQAAQSIQTDNVASVPNRFSNTNNCGNSIRRRKVTKKAKTQARRKARNLRMKRRQQVKAADGMNENVKIIRRYNYQKRKRQTKIEIKKRQVVKPKKITKAIRKQKK